MARTHPQANCPCCGASGADLESGARHGLDRRDFLKVGAGATLLGSAAVALPGSRLWLDHAGAATTPVVWPAPTIVTRHQWGADESRRKPDDPVFDPLVRKFVVHHTATPNGPHDPAAMVRNVFTYHTSREYIDIAYNFLIDEQGRIYEGRWARNYAHGEVHSTENKSLHQVRGAHSLYYNDRTIGVALLGTYSSVRPPAPMIAALVELLAWKCVRWGVNPLQRTAYTDANGHRTTFDNIVGHRNVFQTSCPGDGMYSQLGSLRLQVAQRVAAGTSPHWVAARDGTVANGGGGAAYGDARGATIVGIAAQPGYAGFWLASAVGRVYARGHVKHYGDVSHISLHQPIVGIAATRTGAGYWLVARDGGIFAFGDAAFHGSMGGRHLDSPMVGIAASPTGRGYWTVAADGGVFTFGDAKFAGSAYRQSSANPAVSMIATPTGRGYWIATRSGAIYPFGTAPRLGVAGGGAGGVVDLARSASGFGVAALFADGTITTLGDFPKIKSVNGRVGGNAVGIATGF